MTVITDIAQRILDENNYTVADISLLNAEYKIKDAVDYVNMECGRSISFTPVAGSEDLTATDAEIVMVKRLAVLLLRGYMDRGPNVGLSALTVTTVANDPQFNTEWKLLERGFERLRGRAFERT